ncbi:MAG TPA: ABC-2 family transporter protein [Anaerolineae bacterium]|nr:ABC-2 family transporter protein [Anaerolineae bacterium]
MKPMIDMYLGTVKISILQQFQYRVANYFYMIGMVAEPVIYLVVWSTVANAQGGSVGGYTAQGFAAYYIVWTLVRNMNIVLTPYAWESRIRRGQLSAELLRPTHPVHLDIGYFAGWKFVVIVMWLPIAAVLTLAFRPMISPTPVEIAGFAVAIWGGFFVRFFLQWALGLLSFWITRVSAIFELYFTIELLFSGRLVPLSLMPEWAQQIAALLPFKWAFQFPIETLIGRLSTEEILFGLGMQALWTAIGIAIVSIVWRTALRRYSAVGN